MKERGKVQSPLAIKEPPLLPRLYTSSSPYLLFCSVLYSNRTEHIHTSIYYQSTISPYDILTPGLHSNNQNMKSISVKERSMVRPAEETPKERIWLSNLDLLHPKRHVRTIYVYKPDHHQHQSSGNFFDTKVLKDALSKALVPFYPMAGRLVADAGAGGRVELECNGEGVLFQEAEADVSLDEVGEFLPSSGSQDQFVSQLVPFVDYSKEISSFPPCILQVTKFKCGGVCIGIGNIHTVSDGQSSLSFINTWSNIARSGSDAASATLVSPFLDRTIFRARNPPTPKFNHTEYQPHPAMIHTNNTPKGPPRVEILNIKPQHIDILKENAIPKNDIVTDPVLRYSTYEILAAHIWRCATKARSLDPQQPTTLLISVDGRSRLNPPVPRDYFGNVIFHTTPTALSGELVSEPLGETVERIRQAISRMDDEYLRSAIDYLEDPDAKFTPGAPSPNVKLVSWMRLPLKSADFGWGDSVSYTSSKLRRRERSSLA
ncbi:HCT [Linum grandiflorum]